MQERQKASSRMLAVNEEELNRIILDIHDGPVQYLFAALSLLTRLQQQANTRFPDPEEMVDTVNKVSELVEESLHEIKSFLGTFRPPEFHRRSLVSLIRGLVIQHEERTGHAIEVTLEKLPEVVNLPVKIAVYRILQEALSNAYRHSGTDQQWVKVFGRKGSINLEIVDKGYGFEPPLLEGPGATEREEHIGLRGMRDRVKLIGGSFQLESHPGKGTRILVKLPLRDKNEARHDG